MVAVPSPTPGPSTPPAPSRPPRPTSRPVNPAGSAPGRARRSVLLAALALPAALAALPSPATAQAPAPAAKPPHVVDLGRDGFVDRLGPVRVGTRSPSLVRAYRAFGRPTSASGKANVRRVRWSKAGISVVGATFGGCRRARRCRTDELRIQTARLTGPRWQTEAGLRVSDPLARVLELYPRAEADRTGALTIAKVRNPYGEGDLSIVAVQLDSGTVKALEVYVGDAGE